MYIIDAETIEWAYRKLKAYYYSYYGNNLLKCKIIDFENKLKIGGISFQAIADALNRQVNDTNWVNLYGHIDYVVYPKKNAFKRADDGTILERYNAFIDMPIEYYFVDVLFALNLLERFSEENFNFAYAFKKSSCFDRTEDLLHNNYLFEYYWEGYKSWCSIPRLSYCKDNTSPRTILKLDVKECFYNTVFDFRSLIDYLGVTNNVSLIMGSVYRQYSYTVLNDKYGISKEKYTSILPVGLMSSSIIQNYLYSALDKKISSNANVISYGRFVDDIYIVLQTRNPLPLVDVLKEIFHESIEVEDNEVVAHENVETRKAFYIKPFGRLKKRIPINKDKILTRFIKENEAFEINYTELIGTSFVDDIYHDDLNLNNEIKIEDSDIKETKSLIDSYNPKYYSEIKKAINNLTDCDLLNCFSLWQKIFKIAFENNDQNFVDSISERIRRLIKTTKFEIDTEENCHISHLLQRQLNFELEFAKTIFGKSAYDLALMANVDDPIIQNIISGFKEEYRYIPFLVGISDISMFYSKKYGELTYKLKNDVIDTYKEINHLSNLDGYEIESCNLIECKGFLTLTHRTKAFDKNPDVAVAGLNMNVFPRKEDLGKYSLKENFGNLGNYTIYDLKRVVDDAYINKANYLLLPEFAVKMGNISQMVKYCRKRHMSLVCGIEHYAVDGVAYNMTCIFDKNTNLVFFKPKNYLPLEEKIIVSKRGYNVFEPTEKKYLIVDDGMLSYSSMTCYEATNIIDRALLADKINFLFVPVYNKDTNYFSNIIESYCRDASIFIAQANCNKFGDSRIREPSKTETADLVKIKGGDNNYVVVSKIDIKTLEEDNKNFLENYDKVGEYKEKKMKPLNAGNHHYIKKEKSK